MIKKCLKISFLLIFVFSLLLGGMPFAKAIGITPIKYDDIVVDPGESVTRQMTVYNESKTKKTYYMHTKSFAAEGEDGGQTFLDSETGLVQWVSYSQNEMTLDGGEDITIDVNIDVPMDAEPGGHYAVSFVTLDPPSEDGIASGASLGSNVGLLLLVKVNGDINEDSELLEFGIVEEKTKGNRLPTTFYTRTKNSGTVHFKPRGTIDIYNMIGRKSESVPANPLGGNVLPKSVRRLEARWLKSEDHNTDGGFFKELSNEWHNFALGRYKAVLNMEWSETQEPLTGTVTFWVFPWRVLLVALIIIVILLSGLKGYNKMIINSAKR